MSDIIIKMRDGSVQRFMHEGRAGGSYTKSVTYESGFVVIKDEWGKRIAIPMELVAEVEERPNY